MGSPDRPPAKTAAPPTHTNPSSSPSVSQSLLLVGAVAFRPLLHLAAPGLVGWLEERPELGTPMSAVEGMREGAFLLSKGLNPYESGSFHVNPLYLNLFSVFPLDSPAVLPLSVILWTAADVCAALALRAIYLSRVKGRDGATVRSGDDGGDWGWTVMILYLLNPYTILTNLARSTVSLDNAVLLGGIACAAQGQSLMALYLLAIPTMTQLYLVLILPPLIMLVLRDSAPPAHGSGSERGVKWDRATSIEAARLVAWYAGCLAATIGIAWSFVGDLRFISATWGTILSLSDLTPNVGMWWYFFTEMFEHFRVFFLGVFQLHVAIYIAPLCIRLRRQPLLVTTLMVGIISTFKSYPTLGDAAAWIGLIGCFPELWSDLRYPLLTCCIHLYTLILLPLLHDLWLVAGTGNANFFYAATLVYNLGCGMAIVDLLGAGLRWEVRQVVEERLRATPKGTGEIGSDKRGRVGGHDPPRDLMGKMGLHVVQYTTL